MGLVLWIARGLRKTLRDLDIVSEGEEVAGEGLKRAWCRLLKGLWRAVVAVMSRKRVVTSAVIEAMTDFMGDLSKSWKRRGSNCSSNDR